jgi:hypothetical protein
MNAHTELVFAVWFAGCIGISVAAFLGWLLWALFFDIYDHLMQQRTRRKNEREYEDRGMAPFYPKKDLYIERSALDPAQRTGQFSIPKTMRDVKGVHRPLRLPDVRRGQP